MTRTSLRPLGFLAMMLGFGLRLDTGWSRLSGVLILAGAIGAVLGLTAPRAFTHRPDGR